MSRLADAILKGAYQNDATAPMLDLQYGGQQGWSPNLIEWTSNQAYVTRPLVCIVLEFPKMFNYMPEPEKWKASVKALLETHTKRIEGLQAALTVDTDEHAVGGAGEMQEEVVNVTRERSEPNHTVQEKYGRPTQNLLEYWIRYGLMDPDTKTALLGTMNNDGITDLMADWYSATCLYFEPDPLHKRVVKAWLSTNMFPKTTGDINGTRDLTASQELLELSIPFSAISQYGHNVNLFAQSILDQINIAGADPYRKNTIVDDISADVKAVNSTGYTETINTADA